LYLNASPDLTVLAFTVAVALLTGILFALAPALRGTSVNVAPMLKENAASAAAVVSGKSHKFGLGNVLVVAQVTLSVIVLVGAGLVVCSLANLKGVDPGFDTRNILQFGLDPTLNGY
jgi:hypothetical protein